MIKYLGKITLVAVLAFGATLCLSMPGHTTVPYYLDRPFSTDPDTRPPVMGPLNPDFIAWCTAVAEELQDGFVSPNDEETRQFLINNCAEENMR